MMYHYTLTHSNNSATISTRDGRIRYENGTLAECVKSLSDSIFKSAHHPKHFTLLVISDDKDLVCELNGIGESDLWQAVQLELWRFGNYEVKYEP